MWNKKYYISTKKIDSYQHAKLKKKNMGTRLTNTYNKIGMTMLNFIPKNWVQNKLGKFKHDSLWINTMSSQKMESGVVIFTSTLCCSSHQFIILVYVLDRKKKVFMVSLSLSLFLSLYPTHTMTLYKEKSCRLTSILFLIE